MIYIYMYIYIYICLWGCWCVISYWSAVLFGFKIGRPLWPMWPIWSTSTMNGAVWGHGEVLISWKCRVCTSYWRKCGSHKSMKKHLWNELESQWVNHFGTSYKVTYGQLAKHLEPRIKSHWTQGGAPPQL